VQTGAPVSKKPMIAPALDTMNVLVVEDDVLNRQGVVLYLQMNGYLPLEAGDLETAYAIAMQRKPLAAVVDIVIPPNPNSGRAVISQSVGLTLVKLLKQFDPTMGIVIFSAYEDRGGDIWELVREGTRGLAYLLKGSRPEQLLDALREVRAGQVVLSPEVVTNPVRYAADLNSSLTPLERPWVEQALRRIPELTDKEMQVARLVAGSFNNQGISQVLDITIKTVENHVNRVYAKLGLDAVDDVAPSLRKSTLLAKAFMLYELPRGRKDV
jgi:DNA-binding NarL/FixJ family response regulator